MIVRNFQLAIGFCAGYPAGRTFICRIIAGELPVRDVEWEGDSSIKTLLAGIAVTAGLCAISIAQSTPVTIPSAQSNSPQTSGAPLHIAPGSVIPVLLTKSIDAKKVRVGEEVEAKVTQDLKTGDGELIIPKDTKVFGHVTEAQARNKQQKESQLGIAFDHAILKNGENVPLSMSI